MQKLYDMVHDINLRLTVIEKELFSQNQRWQRIMDSVFKIGSGLALALLTYKFGL